jgi:hypothetical protein
MRGDRRHRLAKFGRKRSRAAFRVAGVRGTLQALRRGVRGSRQAPRTLQNLRKRLQGMRKSLSRRHAGNALEKRPSATQFSRWRPIDRLGWTPNPAWRVRGSYPRIRTYRSKREGLFATTTLLPQIEQQSECSLRFFSRRLCTDRGGEKIGVNSQPHWKLHLGVKVNEDL